MSFPRKIKVTMFLDPIVVNEREFEEWRRDGMLQQDLGEADAEGDNEEEEGDGEQEAADQDQAAGRVDAQGQGGGDVPSGVRTQGDGEQEGNVPAADEAPGELRASGEQVEEARPEGRKD
jgi:hypothetical protein